MLVEAGAGAMSREHPFVWRGTAPPGGAYSMVTLRFPPSRSHLLTAQAVAPAVAQTSVLADLQIVQVVLRDPVPAGAQVTVTTIAVGEMLSDPLVKWDNNIVLLDNEPPPEARPDWKDIYDRREHLAQVSAEQSFFFELERATFWPMLYWNPHIPDKAQRKTMAELVGQRLAARLLIRRDGPVAPHTVPSSLDCSQIIHDCTPASLRGQGWKGLSRAMENFAAGELRTMIDWAQGLQYAAAEPDSYYIFLYAELAISVIEDPAHQQGPAAADLIEMWLDVLPSLVKMQSYFCARFEAWNDITDLIRKPEVRLCPKRRAAIDLEYQQANYDARTQAGLAALKQKIHANLQPPPAPPGQPNP